LQKTADPPWLWPQAAYIHIPFCAHHCGYCDFAVATGRDDFVGRYLKALEKEMAALGEPQAVRSIFLGGGTPTYLNAAQLERLLRTIGVWCRLMPEYEFSVEANPGTLTGEKIAVLATHGVNRLSLGAQSFRREALHVLERDHDPEDVPKTVELARKLIPQVSLDLIFGVPGQALPDWQGDLERALALGPDHISTYGLTYEKGTPLWKQRERGGVVPLAEDQELAMYTLAMDTLGAAGFEHYEISNFARTGRRSIHNQVYWANEAYWGFGMGAARYVNGRRDINTRSLDGYINKVLAGESAVFQSETLPPRERARETMAMQLRRSEGIERSRFLVQTGFELDSLAGSAIPNHVELELLADDGATVSLTRKGKPVADTVIRNLFSAGA
jgi:oxygen-independent coproporphyrinogen-3 oxidase